MPGFGMRLKPSGNKSFVLKYRFKGHQRMVTLDRYPTLSLSEARSKARAILGHVHEGVDPKQTDIQRAKNSTFGEIFEAYLEKYCAVYTREVTRKEIARVVRKEFLPLWSKRDVNDIGKADVVAVLDAIIARGAPSLANHAFRYISMLFNWALSRGVMEISPCYGLSAPAPLKSRKRVLSDSELATVWHSAGNTPYPFGSIVRLLILTGQRCGEVTKMHWDHIDFADAIWTLPSEHTKNKREYSVPLSPAVVDILSTDGVQGSKK